MNSSKPYQDTTIREVLTDISLGRVYLPALQRKYVWKDDQVYALFDSILRGYPIGSFLFWDVTKGDINSGDYALYSFIKDYHELNGYMNCRAPQPFDVHHSSDRIAVVLDGQQRLTSLYIALQGTMARKKPKARANNPRAYEAKELYFNLHSNPERSDSPFEFRFMTPAEAEESSTNPKDAGRTPLWYPAKDVLQYTQADLLTKVILPLGLASDTTAVDNLGLLLQRLTLDPVISFFNVSTSDMDEVLDVFVRVNSGGTILSKSDLIFSTIVSQWEDARDEIDELVRQLNQDGDGFKFTSDFVIRAALYVLGIDPKLKAQVFTHKRVDKIRMNWNRIREAIAVAVDLLVSFGFSNENIVSYNAILPIIYYIYHGGSMSTDAKRELQHYFVVAQLKGLFGASSDTTLSAIRRILDKHVGEAMDVRWFEENKWTGWRSFMLTAEDIDNFFDDFEKGPYTFMILSLLQPDLQLGTVKFHQDHLHPYAAFTDAKLKDVMLADGAQLTDAKRKEWRAARNRLGNLQLLTGSTNLSKSAQSLNEWLADEANSAQVRFLPEGVSTDIAYFDEFMAEREKLMKEELKRLLQIR